LQPFGHPENSESFSVISVIIFEVNIVDEQKQTYLVTNFLFFISNHCPQLLYCPPCPTTAPASLNMHVVSTNFAKTLFANVNMASYCEVANSVYPVAMTAIRHCSVLEFNRGHPIKMKEALDDLKEGICVGGELVQSVRYANDQAMTANTEKGLQNILDETSKVVKKYGMKINIKKTKVLKIVRKPSTTKLTVDGEILQQVEEFKYLGSILSSSGYSEKDIRVRIGMAKSAFNKLKKLFTGVLKLEVKKRLVKTLVWSVAMYGSETWTIKRLMLQDWKHLKRGSGEEW